MKKELIILLAIMLLCPILVDARAEVFSTKINVSTSQNVTTLTTENGMFTIGPNTRNQITVSLYRNTSCKEDLLIDYLMKSDIRNNESIRYQKLYGNCSVKLAICQSDAYIGNISYKSKLDQCNAQLAQNNCGDVQNQLNACNTEKAKNTNDKNTTMVIAAAVGLGLGYMMWGRKAPATPMSKFPQQR
jgi:hypothetical protein